MSCIVRRDKNSKITSVVIPNINNIEVVAVQRNNNLPLDTAPNGEPSILHQTFINEGASVEDANKLVAYTYSDEFGQFFGRWWEDPNNASKVVDENGQPMVVWNGIREVDTKLLPPDVDFLGYEVYGDEYNDFEQNGNTEHYRFSSSAFFLESKESAFTFVTGFTGSSSKHYAKLVESSKGRLTPAFVNIRNYEMVEELSPTLIPYIDESIEKGIDGFRGPVKGVVEPDAWLIKTSGQVLPVTTEESSVTEEVNDGTDGTMESTANKAQIEIKQNETIPSQLFDELKSLPFITDEQALEIYKHVHSDKMNFWKDNNNLNCK